MLEPPHYRPKVYILISSLLVYYRPDCVQLFKTIHDQLGRAGEEECFPDSDNASKLKRSCENAEHVGGSLLVIQYIEHRILLILPRFVRAECGSILEGRATPSSLPV